MEFFHFLITAVTVLTSFMFGFTFFVNILLIVKSHQGVAKLKFEIEQSQYLKVLLKNNLISKHNYAVLQTLVGQNTLLSRI